MSTNFQPSVTLESLLPAANLPTVREALGLGAAGCTCVFEGDSITSGPSSGQRYSDYCAELSWFQGATIYNSSVMSSVIGDVAGRYTEHVYPHRPTANGGDGGPRAYLFLMIGVNDIGAGTTAIDFLNALNAYTEQAQEDGFIVVLGTPTGYYGWSATQLAVWFYVRNCIFSGNIFNPLVSPSVTGPLKRDIVWDAAQIQPQTDFPGWTIDGLHYTATWNQLVASYLNAVMTSGSAVRAPRAVDYDTQTMAQMQHIDFPDYSGGGIRLIREGGWLRLKNFVSPYDGQFAAAAFFTTDGFISLDVNSHVIIVRGTGNPEGAATARVGSLFLRSDGSAGNTLYVKESGTGNTGWGKVTTTAA